MTNKHEENLIKDHELVTWKLQTPDKFAVGWCVVTTIVYLLTLPSWLTSETVFSSIPRSVLYCWVGGILTIIIALVVRFLYLKHFTELEQQGGAQK